MSAFFHTILLDPLLNITVWIYNVIPGHDLGVSIIVLTVAIRLILSPLSLKALRSQREMNDLAPKIKEVQEKFKNDKAAQSAAVMQLYKDHGVNPFGGCLPLLIQLPLLIGLYRTFLTIARGQDLGAHLYSFVAHPAALQTYFLGLINTATKNPYLAILAGLLQFVQAKMSMQGQKTNSTPGQMGAALNTQMLYFFPVMIIIISWNLPAGLTLYWVATTLFSIGEQFYLRRIYGRTSPKN